MIPEIIARDGQKPKIRILDDEEYRAELKKKLFEEAKEVFEAKSNNDLMKEIGDVEEVIDSIIKTYDLNRRDIDEMREKRKKIRGGFLKRIFLEEAE